MSDSINSWERRSIQQKWNKPEDWWFEDREAKRENGKERARETIRNEEVVVLGDADADGLGAVAAVREYYDEEVAFVSSGPHGGGIYLGDALWACVDALEDGARLIIQDVAVDEQWKMKALPEVAEVAGEILWFDHHEWSDGPAAFAREHVDHFELDTGEDDEAAGVYNARSAAMMVRDFFVEQGHEFSAAFEEAMDVTGEYDLWRLRDERCHDLNDLSHVVDDDTYISLLREHGADVLNDEESAAAVETYRAEQSSLHDLAVEHAELYQVGDRTVAAVYGNCPINKVAETLREQADADAMVLAMPHGGLSLRGSESFTQCHHVAELFDGGGHEKAAGAGLYDLFGDDQASDIAYDTHWETNGTAALDVVLEEVAAVVADSPELPPVEPLG
jgi:oligoribonuclease NrnB/cAMP/cGMP phosphodiesterase (DHH superfamily)